MGLVYYGIHKEAALSVQKKYGIKTIVETGTWHGDSTLWAAEYFDLVYTVELDPDFYTDCLDRFEHIDNIMAFCGDTRDRLPLIINKLTEPTLFFLDAHWTGEAGTHDEIAMCPAVDEIEIINKLCKVEHVIIVDDVRMMKGRWCDKKEIERVLRNGGTRAVQIFDDIFLAEPNRGN